MRVRWTPVFEDEDGTLVSRTSDTQEEAEAAGRELHTEHVRFTKVIRYMSPFDIARRAEHLGMRAKVSAHSVDQPRWTGFINNWFTEGLTNGHVLSYGFATAPDGRSWFVSSQELPAGLDTLPRGTVISWSGSGDNSPGEKRPTAWTVRVEHLPDEAD